MRLLVFNNINEYKKFFDSVKKEVMDEMEYRLFRNFNNNKILILAEHAFTERIPAPRYGKKAFIGIGDRNTDILAKMAALSSGSAYIVPWISRRKIDFARDPKLVGKGNKLLVAVYNTDPLKKIYVPVHKDENCLPILMRYTALIRKLKPKFILSYHGMHKRHIADISIGSGPDFRYLGGRAKAKEFVDYVREEINKGIKDMGFKFPLDIRLSTIFLGHRNYTLASYTKKGAIGCQVEFNLRGRTSEKLGMPKRKFQLAAQIIPRCINDFYGK